MSKGINKVILVAHLGADPESRTTQSGSTITSIRVATSESWKDKQTGETQERTEWHRVKFFGRLAEIAAEYLRKGSQVYIEGSLRTEKYTDKEGVERYSTDVIANEMQMLGSSDRGREGRGQSSGAQSQSNASSQPARSGYGGGGNGGGARSANQRPSARPQPHQAHPQEVPAGFDDDEIPFVFEPATTIW